MRNLAIATNIAQLRRHLGATQDDLAGYLGVSKASVSKWETGQSYPDITLLPKLATYFGTSIDDLVGYAPQLDRDGIRRTYRELAQAFAQRPFAEAFGLSEERVHDFWSCGPFLTQAAVLYLNHLPLAPTSELRAAVAGRIADIAARVRQTSDDVNLVRQVNAVEANLSMMQGDPARAIELLGPAVAPSMGEAVLLSAAHAMLGDARAAELTVQAAAYQALVELLGDLCQMAAHAVDDPERLREVWRRTVALADAFDLEGLYPNCSAVYLSFAAAFAQADCADEALTCLERNVRVCRAHTFPLALHGDGFFNLLDGWFDDLDLGGAAPRSEDVVKQSLLDAVQNNSVFAALAASPRYRTMLANLKEALR